MPKATPRLEKTKSKSKSKSKDIAAAPTTTSSKGKSTSSSPRIYSNFLPIPLLLPSPSSLASSSKSKSDTIKHHIYCRPHQSKSIGDDTGGRTVFVVNLPVDIGERDLRSVFGRWGVVESVVVGKNDTKGGDMLEKEVRGIKLDGDVDDSDSEDEDEDGDEDDDAEVEAVGEGGRAEPTFQGDINSQPQTRTARRKAKKAAAQALDHSIPTIAELPSLDPRHTPLGVAGSHSAHITFVDALSVTRLMGSIPSSIQLSLPSTKFRSKGGNYNTASTQEEGGEEEPVGLSYYEALHQSLRPSLDAIRAYADTSMAKHDYLHSLLLSSRAKQRGAGALVDEDGFTVVVRSGRYGRAGARGDGLGNKGVGITSHTAAKKAMAKKGGKGAQELEGFYKFQKLDKRRQELADLRSKFEQDKAKVDELKKSRRFKPY